MFKLKIRLKSFQVQVTLVLILAMFLALALSNLLLYKFALNSQFEQLRDKVKMVAATASLMIEPQILEQVALNRQATDSLPYKVILEKLQRIKKVNQPIRFIYIMARTEQEGILQFVVDADPVVTGKGRSNLTALPGDKYDASHFREMLNGFKGPSADNKIETDQWGATLSGYAPIFNATGKAIAILGVDIMAADIYKTQREFILRAFFVLILGIVFSIVLGILFSRRITKPIEEILIGTRHVSIGDLSYQVKVRGDDEISELARNFNKMAAVLERSKRRLHNYFYRVIQSLVRIIEAKDHYTRGHSERVAEYAQKIALKFGFSAENVELVRETALLHDIGKLGIQDSILNKKDALTPQEWEMIRQHPAIGEDILKPILLNPDMLTIIKGHHERFDHKGHLDNTGSEKVGLFTQIVSVADAFDAMTSSRAYRQAMGKEKAVEELKKNRGSQFDPKVVDVFLEILKGETS